MKEEPDSRRDSAPESRMKEKPSRLARHRREEARLRRRLTLGLVGILAVALVVGSILDLPVASFPRHAWRWLRARISSPGSPEEEAPTYLFRTHPQTGKQLENGVSVLLGLTAGKEGEGPGDLLYLVLFTFLPQGGGLEAYVIPEMLLTYDASGSPLRLRESLRRDKWEDLLRSTVGNLAGVEVDYLLLCAFRDAVRALQSLELPPVVLEEDAQFRDPVTGERQSVFAGQRIGDADRLIYYLLAVDRTDYWDGYFRRVDRLKEYLPRALGALGEKAGAEEPWELLGEGGGITLYPGTGSAGRDASYVLSMLQAAVAAAGRELPCRGIPRVEILNGCGVPELGRKVGNRLADMGIPLGDTGRNAKVVVDGEEVNDFSHQESLIICRSADPRARAFAKYLGVQLSVKEVREEPGPGAEVVLVAGRDMASRGT